MSLKVKSQEELMCHNDVKKEFDDSLKDESRCGPVRKKRLPACLSILCPVCGGPAPDHVHFGGQCCYSCRAFFRRTSVKSVSSFRCRSGKNDCVISSGIKSCIPCRLQKCLQVGMDPSLVRGKKIKNREERDTSYSPEMSPNEDEAYYDQPIKPVMFPKPPPLLASGSIIPQENILKRKAEILKCQGAYLQFQASLLEREAHNTMKVTEERVRMMREMMGARMPGMYREDPGYHPGRWSPVKTSHHEDIGYERPVYPEYKKEKIVYHPQRPVYPEYKKEKIVYHPQRPVYPEYKEERIVYHPQRPVYPEYREERIVYHPQRPESPEPLGVPLSQDSGVLDDNDDGDHPLDLSVHSSPNLHTQSQNMPRIFFSLSGPRR